MLCLLLVCVMCSFKFVQQSHLLIVIIGIIVPDKSCLRMLGLGFKIYNSPQSIALSAVEFMLGFF